MVRMKLQSFIEGSEWSREEEERSMVLANVYGSNHEQTLDFITEAY
jgi:hypothetical protein